MNSLISLSKQKKPTKNNLNKDKSLDKTSDSLLDYSSDNSSKIPLTMLESKNPIKQNESIKNRLINNEKNINSNSFQNTEFINSTTVKREELNDQSLFSKVLNKFGNLFLFIKNIVIYGLLFFILLFLLVFIFQDSIMNYISSFFTNILNSFTKSDDSSKDKNNNHEKLNKQIKKTNNKNKENHHDDDNEVKPNDTENSQSGFCYIGKVNNKRSCAKISDEKYCMSGEFFSTKKLCKKGNIK